MIDVGTRIAQGSSLGRGSIIAAPSQTKHRVEQNKHMSTKNKYMIEYTKTNWPQRTRGPLTRAGALVWLAKCSVESIEIGKVRFHSRILTAKHREDLTNAAKLWAQLKEAELQLKNR